MTIVDDLMQANLDLRREGLVAMRDLRGRLDDDFELYLDIVAELMPMYMKPTTATLEESMRADAARDAKYLGIAADAVLAEVIARRAASN
jgi:hypothetical protein